jgi:hypothetical protein
MAGCYESFHILDCAIGGVNLLIVRDVVSHVNLDGLSELIEYLIETHGKIV